MTLISLCRYEELPLFDLPHWQISDSAHQLCVYMCVYLDLGSPGQGLVVISFPRALGLVMKEQMPVACAACAKVMFPVNV